MPLHDWSDDSGWQVAHHSWITELLRWIKARLPEGYRTFLSTAPGLAVDLPGHPDVGVAEGTGNGPIRAMLDPIGGEGEYIEAEQQVAVTTLMPEPVVLVARHGRMVAAVEVISPANKDRPSSREAACVRYAAYLKNCVNLLVIDVLPKPHGFSFADAIAAELEIPDQRPLSTPCVISYRVGEQSLEGGRYLGIWRRSLPVGAALPTIPLPLNTRQQVEIDLEATYTRAAADAYLD